MPMCTYANFSITRKVSRARCSETPSTSTRSGSRICSGSATGPSWPRPSTGTSCSISVPHRRTRRSRRKNRTIPRRASSSSTNWRTPGNCSTPASRTASFRAGSATVPSSRRTTRARPDRRGARSTSRRRPVSSTAGSRRPAPRIDEADGPQRQLFPLPRRQHPDRLAVTRPAPAHKSAMSIVTSVRQDHPRQGHLSRDVICLSQATSGDIVQFGTCPSMVSAVAVITASIRSRTAAIEAIC